MSRSSTQAFSSLVKIRVVGEAPMTADSTAAVNAAAAAVSLPNRKEISLLHGNQLPNHVGT